MRRGMIVFFTVVALAAVGVAKPAAMDGAVGAWEQLAAKAAAFSK